MNNPINISFLNGINHFMLGSGIPTKNLLAYFKDDGGVMVDSVGESVITITVGSADGFTNATFKFEHGTTFDATDAALGGDVLFDSSSGNAPFERTYSQWLALPEINSSVLFIFQKGVAMYSEQLTGADWGKLWQFLFGSGLPYSYKSMYYRRKLLVSGSDSVLADQIIKVRLHHGENPVSDTNNQDLFCDGNVRTDFSDVRFTLADGTELEHWRASYGNWEFIPDSRLAYNTIIDTSGNLWKVSTGLYKSEDNGETWALKDSLAVGLVYVADNGNVFTSRDGGTVYRSTEDGANPSLILTLDAGAAILRFDADEDSEGRLFFGQYQEDLLATIYRSTDDGATWQAVLRIPDTGDAGDVVGTTSPKGSAQHFHGLAVDPYTDYIYAGADSTGGAPDPSTSVYRSIDHGASWGAVWSDDAADAMGFIFYGDHRLFGGEAGSDKAIVLTEDDITYDTVISRGTFGMLAKHGDNIIAGGSTAGTGARYPQLFRSTDQGRSFVTILMESFNDDGGFSSGHEFGGGYGEARTPTGDAAQILMGKDGEAYHNGRFYDAIPGKYEAEFYLKVPSVPTAGQTIYACFGCAPASSESNSSDLYTTDVALGGLVARYKLNEGSGALATDSVNSHNLTVDDEAWSGEPVAEFSTGRLPYHSIPGDSLEFNGARAYEIPGSDSHADFNFTKNYSVVFWVEPNKMDGDKVLISKGDYSDNNGWAIKICERGDNPSIYFHYSNGTANTSVFFTPQLRITQKQHIGMSLDNASPPNAYLLINGQLQGAVALAYEPISGTGPVVIGALGDSSRSDKLTHAKLDDIRFYKDKAITQNEGRQIYEHRLIASTNEPEVEMIGYLEPQQSPLFDRVDYSLITGSTYYLGPYVNNGDGSEPAPSLTEGGAGAFNSLTDAISTCVAGDAIIVLPGKYNERIDPNGKDFYLVSTGGPFVTTIDMEGSDRASIFNGAESAACVVDGFTLTGGAGNSGGGLYATTGSPTIRNCVMRDNDLSSGSGVKGGGLYLDGTAASFENCLIANNKADVAAGIGGNAYIKNSTSQFTHCTFVGGEALAGGNIKDYTATTTYINCIDWDGAPVSSFSTDPDGLRMTYSCVEKDSGIYVGTGNINSDPKFVSASDHSLQSDSPCRNTGTDTGVETDILDNDRDATPDMGAYQGVFTITTISDPGAVTMDGEAVAMGGESVTMS